MSGWTWRKKRRGAVGGDLTKDSYADALAHLDGFVLSRRGVEVYLEPATSIVGPSVALVASDGEWTRRRISSPRAAAAFADKHAIPLYEAAVRGYPQRMRDWTGTQAAKARAARSAT